MWKDLIVEEVRRVRDDYARKFDYNIHAICEDCRKRQDISDHKVVSRTHRTPLKQVAA
jgi:hypothetical protein